MAHQTVRAHGRRRSKAVGLKPHNSGQWTQARLRSFIMSALRRAQWPPKYKSIAQARICRAPNPKTGKMAMLHSCPCCKSVYTASDMHADHREPVVPVNGVWGETTRFLGYNWNELLQRLLVEVDGFDAICKTCHKEKTKTERKQRAECKTSANQ